MSKLGIKSVIKNVNIFFSTSHRTGDRRPVLYLRFSRLSNRTQCKTQMQGDGIPAGHRTLPGDGEGLYKHRSCLSAVHLW